MEYQVPHSSTKLHKDPHLCRAKYPRDLKIRSAPVAGIYHTILCAEPSSHFSRDNKPGNSDAAGWRPKSCRLSRPIYPSCVSNDDGQDSGSYKRGGRIDKCLADPRREKTLNSERLERLRRLSQSTISLCSAQAPSPESSYLAAT
eukprot:scaffold4743_cov171-Amphora_coffeaeformis.AAC.13